MSVVDMKSVSLRNMRKNEPGATAMAQSPARSRCCANMQFWPEIPTVAPKRRPRDGPGPMVAYKMHCGIKTLAEAHRGTGTEVSSPV